MYIYERIHTEKTRLNAYDSLQQLIFPLTMFILWRPAMCWRRWVRAYTAEYLLSCVLEFSGRIECAPTQIVLHAISSGVAAAAIKFFSCKQQERIRHMKVFNISTHQHRWTLFLRVYFCWRRVYIWWYIWWLIILLSGYLVRENIYSFSE